MVGASTSAESVTAEDELSRFYERLVRVSHEVCQQNKLGKRGCANGQKCVDVENENEERDGGSSPSYILPVVEYEDPPRKDAGRVLYVMKHMHSMTAADIRKELKLIHVDSRGKRPMIYQRLKKYFRKEFAILKNAEPQRNKTEKFYEYLVVVDFECTCEDEIYDYNHEIIEFPAMLVDVQKKEVVDTFREFVRPVLNPVLSEFCIKLTGITQEMVDSALPFSDVFDLFRQWMQAHRLGKEGARYAFVTDGPWDIAKFLQTQCILSHINPMPHDFRYYINIRKSFANKYSKGRSMPKMNLNGMLTELGLKFVGREHSGLDDSRNIARIVIRMLEDRAELRINEKLVRWKETDKVKPLPVDMSKEDRERQAWKTQLPLKFQQINRDAFISGEYLDCESCDEL